MDLQDTTGRVELPAWADQGAALATPARDGATRRCSLPSSRGIAGYCDHPVPFGVESVNTTIKAVLRRARGMRDEQMLLLKLKWATAHPILSGRDLALSGCSTAVPKSVKKEKKAKLPSRFLEAVSLFDLHTLDIQDQSDATVAFPLHGCGTMSPQAAARPMPLG